MTDTFNEKQVIPEKVGSGEKLQIDSNQGSGTDNAVTKNGFKVHPQPTSDPLDPLTWSALRKNTILGIVMFKYFMFTFITTITVPSFVELQDQFQVSYSQINWTLAIPALGLAVGPLLWSSFADIYGRRLIFMLGTLMAFGASIGTAMTPTYGGYMAARFFQGLGVSPAATVGLAAINDLFFEHERGQKVGLWVLAIDTGAMVGPILGGFLNIVSPAWTQWFVAILFGVLFIMEFTLMPETLYPRTHMLASAPLNTLADETHIDVEKIRRRRSDASIVSLRRTRNLPYVNYKPVPGLRHPKPWDSLVRFILSFKSVPLVIAVSIYCYMWYWWLLSILTMLPVAYPSYSPQIQGLLFIGLLLGTLFAEIFLGGRLSDYVVLRLTRANDGVRMPEMRLWFAYPAGVLTAVGLVVWGISIERSYHWIVGEIAFFIFAAGIQMGNTTTCAYIVDAYPLQSMSVITFYSVLLNLSAFIEPFFIATWQAQSGWTWSFAAQGIIIFFGAMPAIGLLHYFGPRLRAWSGQPNWVNPEFDTL